MQAYRYPPLAPGPGDKALDEILRHIAVPKDVLGEAKARRNLVCELAMGHAAARATWYSGSIAHGTHNSPLGDADCGVMVDRRSLEFRAYGPDAEGTGLGPEMFIQTFVETAARTVEELDAELRRGTRDQRAARGDDRALTAGRGVMVVLRPRAEHPDHHADQQTR